MPNFFCDLITYTFEFFSYNNFYLNVGGIKLIMKKAYVNKSFCVACGMCVMNCPVDAAVIVNNIHAEIMSEKCVGCSMCAKVCPASTIVMKEVENIE